MELSTRVCDRTVRGRFGPSFQFSVHMHTRGTAGSSDNPVFRFLRNHHSVFPSAPSSLAPAICEGSNFSHLLQHLLFCIHLFISIFIIVIHMNVKGDNGKLFFFFLSFCFSTYFSFCGVGTRYFQHGHFAWHRRTKIKEIKDLFDKLGDLRAAFPCKKHSWIS